MTRNRAHDGLPVEQGDGPGLGIDGVCLGRSGLLALVVVDFVDDVEETLGGVEGDERRVGARDLLDQGELARFGIDAKHRQPDRIFASAARRVLGVGTDIGEARRSVGECRFRQGYAG